MRRRRRSGAGAGGDPLRPVQSIRFDRGELRRGDEIIRITEREREILDDPRPQRRRRTCRARISAGGTGANERTVDVQINRLRRKIEVDPANPVFLQTVRGVGYRLLVER